MTLYRTERHVQIAIISGMNAWCLIGGLQGEGKLSIYFITCENISVAITILMCRGWKGNELCTTNLCKNLLRRITAHHRLGNLR